MVKIPKTTQHKMSLFRSSSLSTLQSFSHFWPIIAQREPTGRITTRKFVSDWARRHVNDPYVKQSLKDGYRCRSAYKLIQIQQKFKLFKAGQTVMECGCSPGSWSQVAAKYINAGQVYDPNQTKGFLVGCDLLKVEEVAGAKLFGNMDFTHEQSQKVLIEAVENRPFDLVISDMAPNASGVKTLDHDRLMKLAFQVKDFCLNHGQIGTSMVIKVWQGNLLDPFVKMLKKNHFQNISLFKPKASRADSAEVYIIAQNLKL